MDMYRGEKGKCDTIYNHNEDSRIHEEKVNEIYVEMLKYMTPELKIKNEKLLKAIEDSHLIEKEFFYEEGFKLGLLLSIEAAGS